MLTSMTRVEVQNDYIKLLDVLLSAGVPVDSRQFP